MNEEDVYRLKTLPFDRGKLYNETNDKQWSADCDEKYPIISAQML